MSTNPEVSTATSAAPVGDRYVSPVIEINPASPGSDVSPSFGVGAPHSKPQLPVHFTEPMLVRKGMTAREQLLDHWVNPDDLTATPQFASTFPAGGAEPESMDTPLGGFGAAVPAPSQAPQPPTA